MVETTRRKSTARVARTAQGKHDHDAGSLRGRIPHLQAAHAAALRDFFAASQHWALRDGGTLTFAPGAAAAARSTFILEGDGEPLALELQSDDGAAPDDGLHWSDYSGRSRLLAWSLAHETQLMRLSDGLGMALIPVEGPADGADDGDADARLWLDFAIRDAGVALSASPRHRGKLRLPYAWLPRLLDRAEQPFLDDPLPALGPWRALAAPVAIRFAGPELAAADWRALRPGDVVVVGTRTRPPQVSAHAAGAAWPLAAMPGGWRVDGAAQSIPSAHRESPAMNDNETSAASTPVEIDEDAGARKLPVQLEFEIGRIEMSVGELSTLQPGYVFALPAHLEGANVTIRANGRASGRGEVVAVGDTLGVRLLSWS
jgi:type III secretion protein Q